jgi:hypothetical protein
MQNFLIYVISPCTVIKCKILQKRKEKWRRWHFIHLIFSRRIRSAEGWREMEGPVAGFPTQHNASTRITGDFFWGGGLKIGIILDIFPLLWQHPPFMNIVEVSIKTCHAMQPLCKYRLPRISHSWTFILKNILDGDIRHPTLGIYPRSENICLDLKVLSNEN